MTRVRSVGVDLAGGPRWGPTGVSPGDLLRVGERIVVLVEDLGTPEQLDYSDLCFDYFRGAKIKPLREVFVGEGLVEWVALTPSSGSVPETPKGQS